MRKSKKLRKQIKHDLIRNKKLCKQYPFLIPWKGWNGNREVYGWRKGEKYDYIMWDFWPSGWNKVLAPQLLKELGEAVEISGFKNKFHVVDGKEKWGMMELDVCPLNDEIMAIINKYEEISQSVCIGCGKPDTPMITKGWISPWCFDCFKKDWRKRDKYCQKNNPNFVPATDEDILENYKLNTN